MSKTGTLGDRAARIARLTIQEGPLAAARSARRHKVREHLRLLAAGWRPRGKRIVKGEAWLPLDPSWAIATWMEPLVNAGFRFENAGPSEFLVTADEGASFVVESATLVDALSALHERFVLREYQRLDVAKAVVIDVGAYIGDSAVYFAHSGAEKVYSFEPFEPTYSAATRNVHVNGLEDVITIRNVGLGASSGTVTGMFATTTPMLSATIVGPGEADVPGRAGRSVELVTLDSVIAEISGRHPNRRLVCKMDCEGAEFDVLTAASVSALSQLDQVLVEYHYREPSPLVSVLEGAGFSVEDLQDRKRVEDGGQVGILFAYRHKALVP